MNPFIAAIMRGWTALSGFAGNPIGMLLTNIALFKGMDMLSDASESTGASNMSEREGQAMQAEMLRRAQPRMEAERILAAEERSADRQAAESQAMALAGQASLERAASNITARRSAAQSGIAETQQSALQAQIPASTWARLGVPLSIADAFGVDL